MLYSKKVLFLLENSWYNNRIYKWNVAIDIEGEFMGSKQLKMKSEYQLRHAAGKYWLLNMEQKGLPYERPILLNSVGAEMCGELRRGKTPEQIAEVLGQRYEVEAEEIKADVLQFFKQLAAHGVFTEE